MPVTITPADVQPKKWKSPKASTSAYLFQRSCPEDHQRSVAPIQTSFRSSLFNTSHVTPSENGFVWAVIEAYNGHHNLTIRPEDVWFSILTQLCFYINAHAEELRSYFVSHEGKKQLDVGAVGNIWTVDFGTIALQMTELIQKNVVDEDLRAWIMPDFTTTTESDKVVAAILMMGSMKKYFEYGVSLLCGIPSVTLLGEREDWKKLVKKLDKLHKLGDEPARFAQLLRPILNHFVDSFDHPTSEETLRFWKKCAHKDHGSGSPYYSGWVTAFCFWDEVGRLRHRSRIFPASSSQFEARDTERDLKDVLSSQINSKCIPPGYASVPVTVNDNGHEYKTIMVAGSVGIQVTASGNTKHRQQLEVGSNGESSHSSAMEAAELDSVQPLSGWWMYETKEAEAVDKGGSGI